MVPATSGPGYGNRRHRHGDRRHGDCPADGILGAWRRLASGGLRLRGDYPGGGHSDVVLHLIQVDLGKDGLLSDAEAIIAETVKRGDRKAAEVADTGERHADESIVEIVHPGTPQSHEQPYGLPLA